MPEASDRQAELQEEEYTRLCDEAGLHLRLRRMTMAQAAVAKLLARWPDRTTAQERAGDLAFAQGKTPQARAHYQRALEIEPANGDAERKYGLALLTQTPDEQRRHLIEAVVADPTAHRPSPRKPLNALLSALLFPGLGQLYNRQHEKGLAMLAGGAVLLMLQFYLLVQVPYGAVARSVEGRVPVHEQLAGWQAALTQMSGGYWALTVLLGLAFTGLYAFGVYDAWRQAESQTEKDLGVV
jgi:tetratricopeptide (TPR) repeat protein